MTNLQRQLCQAVASDLRIPQIAEMLDLTQRQVKRHLEKLGMHPDIRIYRGTLRQRIRTYVRRT